MVGYDKGIKTRDFAAALKTQDLIVKRGVTVLWGQQARDCQPGVPTICVVPTEDQFEQGGRARNVLTALPDQLGPASKGRPNVEVTTDLLWTREAGLDLVLYAVATLDVEELIAITLVALHHLLGARDNYKILQGRNDPRGGYSDLSDLYVLSMSIKLPIYDQLRRYTAAAIEITEEVNGP